MSGNSELFEELAEQPVPEAPGRGTPRLRQPERHQLGWQVVAIDDLVARDHPVRAVWAFVEGLDLRALHDAVKAREGGTGTGAAGTRADDGAVAVGDGGRDRQRAAAGPDVRAASRLSLAVRRGVDELPHTVGFSRGAHRGARSAAGRRGGGAGRTGSGGARRAGAGRAQGARGRRRRFVPRRERLGKLAAAAQARVERLRAELEADPAAGDRRQRAAQQRAAREREERVKAALDRMSALEAERARREKTNKAEVSRQKEPRASTTDAEARAMKLADGGFRPAYNMQITSAPQGQVIVAVDIDTTGSDRGLVRPALEQLSAAGRRPSDYLVDGGFTKNDDIEWAHENGIKLWCPPVHNKHGSDPLAPRRDDKPGVADWRRRMASEPGKALYKQRAQAECPNAWARRMGLTRLSVRGKDKARAVLLWFALAHNMLRAFALRRAAMATAT